MSLPNKVAVVGAGTMGNGIAQVLLDRRHGSRMVFDIGRDDQRRRCYFLKIKFSLFAPAEKIPDGAGVGLARMLVADRGEEKLEETLLGVPASPGDDAGQDKSLTACDIRVLFGY